MKWMLCIAFGTTNLMNSMQPLNQQHVYLNELSPENRILLDKRAFRIAIHTSTKAGTGRFTSFEELKRLRKPYPDFEL